MVAEQSHQRYEEHDAGKEEENNVQVVQVARAGGYGDALFGKAIKKGPKKFWSFEIYIYIYI